MKKIAYISFITCAFMNIAFSATTVDSDAPEQVHKLALWVEQKQSIDAIIKNAAEFNKHMNIYEGISCMHKKTENTVERLVHPDSRKLNEGSQVFTKESQIAVKQFFDSVKNKNYGEPGNLQYVGDNPYKEAFVYRINDQDICIAFWVRPEGRSLADL